MYYAVTYDISLAKTRRLAVKLCKQAGLVRVQHSVFVGRAPSAMVRQLEAELRPLLKSRNDSLYVQPLDKAAFRRLRFTGKRVYKQELARHRVAVFI